MLPSRILIADDNETNVELLEAYLSDVSCELGVAVDGRDTLDKVASFKPDLILLDIMMPKLSGFEVCQKLKENPATRGIMILMVTALNELGDIERAVNGIDGVRAGNVIAFGTEGRAGAQSIIVVAETKDGHSDTLVTAISEAVTAEVGVPPREVVLVQPGTMPKTSSGKLQRSACRLQWEAGELSVLAPAG